MVSLQSGALGVEMLVWLFGGILLAVGLVGSIYICTEWKQASDRLNAIWGAIFMVCVMAGLVITIINFSQGVWVERLPDSTLGISLGFFGASVGLPKNKKGLVNLCIIGGTALLIMAVIVAMYNSPDSLQIG